MLWFMKIIFLMLFILLTNTVYAFNKDEALAFCNSYAKSVKTFHLPLKGADSSILFKTEIQCDALTAKHYRQLPNNLINDLASNSFRSHSVDYYCNTLASSRKYGMTYYDIYFDLNMKYVATITVSSKDCF